MALNEFIEKFKSQLEDSNVEVTASTVYSNESYWDSLTAMVVKVMIEDDYGVDIQPEKITSFKTIEDLYNFITENKTTD